MNSLIFFLTAREDAARYLVGFGVPVGVFDDTGMSCIALMVEKMPHIAVEALDQFRVTDTAFRKDYFYLNYLESNPAKWREGNKTDKFGNKIIPDKAQRKALKNEKELACPTTALKVIVKKINHYLEDSCTKLHYYPCIHLPVELSYKIVHIKTQRE